MGKPIVVFGSFVVDLTSRSAGLPVPGAVVYACGLPAAGAEVPGAVAPGEEAPGAVLCAVPFG